MEKSVQGVGRITRDFRFQISIDLTPDIVDPDIDDPDIDDPDIDNPDIDDPRNQEISTVNSLCNASIHSVRVAEELMSPMADKISSVKAGHLFAIVPRQTEETIEITALSFPAVVPTSLSLAELLVAILVLAPNCGSRRGPKSRNQKI
ncbi:hypothetical protein HELRODRAFT_179009 [Helobdella robusta]|uniref:Uncharacterized protein n=1 Tax=Helobdella robusta TaxID=6412 RepID=T1FE18_HELRO|nr:hypothetical protein HELRODRAFT_179009 [Helobdella robusta]ESN95823.1 hypothetical protein HELRODRAFT_179009 [Helobdella robusta]